MASKGHADSRTKRRVLIATILCAGVVFMDSSVATVALPAIQREFGVSTAVQQWIGSSDLLTLSVLLLLGGRLADLFGRKRMFMTGLAGYAALALAAGLSPSAGALIAIRGLQGIAGAMLVPTTLALINSVFPAEERGRAIGTWAAWSGITTILGPIVGGLVIDNLSWRFAFLVTPALALVTLAIGRAMPEYRDEDSVRHLDVPGVLLVVAALGGIVFSLIQGPIAGWTSATVLVAGLVGVLLLPLFVWWERRAPGPVMPIMMFENRNLAVANVVTFFVYAGLYGMFFYVPIYVQSTLGASATVAAAIFMPTTILLFIISPYAGRLNDRYGPRWLMCFGPLVAAGGAAIAGFAGPGQLYTLLLGGIVVFGIGLGFTVTPVTATAIGSAEERFSGVASGFNNAVSRVAGLVAIALMGVIVVQLWQGALSSATSDASPAVRQALAGVEEQAFVLPDAESLTESEAARATELAEQAAQEAFRNGMLLAAALVATGGAVSAICMRKPVSALMVEGEGR